MFPHLGNEDAIDAVRVADGGKSRHCLALAVDPDACTCLPGHDPEYPRAKQWWLRAAGGMCPHYPLGDPGESAKPAMRAVRQKFAEVEKPDARGRGLTADAVQLLRRHKAGRLPEDLTEREFAVLSAALEWVDRPVEVEKKD